MFHNNVVMLTNTEQCRKLTYTKQKVFTESYFDILTHFKCQFILDCKFILAQSHNHAIVCFGNKKNV